MITGTRLRAEGSAALAPFREHGYQVFAELIEPATVAAVGRFLAAQVDLALAELRRDFPFQDAPDLVARIAKDPRQAGDLPHHLAQLLVGHFPLPTRLSRELWAIPESPGVRELLAHLFPGSRMRMHMPPAARFILPGNDAAGVPAHQDISYNRHMERFVTLWVPFVEIDDECGGVVVHHGTGHLADAGVERKAGLFWLEPMRAGDHPRVHCLVPLGGGLLLNQWVVHESKPNRSQRMRLSVDFRFFPDDVSSSKHYLDLADRVVVAPPA